MRRLLLFTVSTLVAGGAFAAAVGLIDSTNQQPIPNADLRYAGKSHAATHAAGAADELSLNASQITAGELPDARIADDITAGQLATNPTACTSGQFVTDISAAGTLTCAAPPAGGGGAIGDGDYGDIVVSGTGTVMTIDAGVVGVSKLASADFGDFTCDGSTCTLDGATGGGTSTTFDGGTYTEVSFGANIALTDDGDGTATVNVSAGTATIGDGDYGDITVSGGGTIMTVDAVRSTDITDSTTAGRAILTAADAAAQRTLLNVEDGAAADLTGAEIEAILDAHLNRVVWKRGTDLGVGETPDTVTITSSTGANIQLPNAGDGDYPGLMTVAQQTQLENAIVTTDIAAGTITPAAGNLDLTGTNGQILVLDLVGNVVAGTLTDAAMTRVTLPTAGNVESWWRNPMAMDAEIVAIWCESDQTVNVDVQVDDGTPADVAGTDIACTSTPGATTTLTGDTVVASGETLDLAIASVAGTPEWLSIQVVVEYK